jgi:Cupin
MPGNHATSLDASVDALSDVLDLIHLRGEELAVVRSVDGTEIRRRAGERMLYIVDQGRVELTVVGEEHLQLETGDLALLATGAAHRLRSPDGGVWMSGRFLVEENVAAPLLAVLPAAIVIRSSEAGFDRLPLGASLLAAELADPTAGSTPVTVQPVYPSTAPPSQA